MKALEKGIQHHEHKKIFEQVMLVENFMVFKKLMIKRNKELELEALQSLERQQNQKAMEESSNVDLEREKRRIELEKNNADIDHAITMSLAADAERKRIMDKEEEELQQAIELSKKEAEDLEKKRAQEEEKKQLELQKKELEKSKPIMNLPTKEKLDSNSQSKSNEPAQIQIQKELTDPNRLNNVESSNDSKANPLDKQKKEEQIADSNKKSGENTIFERQLPSFEEKKTNELPPLKKPELRSELPPIRMQKKIEPELEELLNNKDRIKNELENLKNEERAKIQKSKESEGESMLERKKRLQAQREMLVKKKQAEREQEVNRYKEGKYVEPKENPLQSVLPF